MLGAPHTECRGVCCKMASTTSNGWDGRIVNFQIGGSKNLRVEICRFQTRRKLQRKRIHNNALWTIDGTLLDDRSLNFLMEDTNIRRFKFAVHCWEKMCAKKETMQFWLWMVHYWIDHLTVWWKIQYIGGSNLPFIAEKKMWAVKQTLTIQF